MGFARLTVLLIAACASAGDPAPVTDGLPNGDGNGGTVRTCPMGQFATDVPATGAIVCMSPDAAAKAAIDASCSLYVGWRDSCDGCTAVPVKWGRAGASCMNGAGADNTCTKPTLGGAAIDMFGLNLDGDVNGDDKFYSALHCTAASTGTSTAPCPAGQFVTSLSGSTWSCSSLAEIVVEYMRTSCSLYMGWQDNCDGCVTAPGKWGRANDAACANGAGVDNTCITANLGGETINLFGLSTDGDVNDDDKFHIGMHCATSSPAISTTATMCPAGQYVTGTAPDGSFQCASPMPLVSAFVAQRCSIYYGANDGCDGCLTPPAKWGTARVGACTVGAGASNTCGKFTFGQPTDFFGLNTDGDVDGNDTLYVGFRCN